MNGDNERMGEVLERIGLITADDLAAGLLAQVSSGGRLGDVLVRSRVVTEDQIAEALAEQKDLKHVFLTTAVIDSDAANLLPARFLQRKSIIPVGFEDGRLVLAMSDPLDVEAIDETEMITGYRVTPLWRLPARSRAPSRRTSSELTCFINSKRISRPRPVRT